MIPMDSLIDDSIGETCYGMAQAASLVALSSHLVSSEGRRGGCGSSQIDAIGAA